MFERHTHHCTPEKGGTADLVGMFRYGQLIESVCNYCL